MIIVVVVVCVVTKTRSRDQPRASGNGRCDRWYNCGRWYDRCGSSRHRSDCGGRHNHCQSGWSIHFVGHSGQKSSNYSGPISLLHANACCLHCPSTNGTYHQINSKTKFIFIFFLNK